MIAPDAGLALPGERVLRLLVESILGFLVASISLALFVLAEHGRRLRADRRARELEERWRAALQDVLAGDAAPETLVALVEPHERWHFADYLTDYAILLRGDELDLARTVARVAMPGIASTMFEGSPADVSRHVRAIALLGGPEYGAYLVKALGHEATLVSATAARWLSRPEYAHLAPDVIARLPRFTYWSPQFLGLLLARFGVEAAPPLRALLESPGNAAERVGAARALWWIKDAASADSAARLLESRTLDPALAEGCLRLVERCGVERHAATVRPWCNFGDRRVRAAALGALSVVGTDSDRAEVLDGIRDPNARVALEAAFALARTARNELAPLLQSPDQRTAAIAREALAR